MLERAALLVMLTSTASFAGDEFDTAQREAVTEARRSSGEAKYAQAASVLRELEEKYLPLLPERDRYRLLGVKGTAAVYEQRALYAKTASKDPKAARALLVSLLAERGLDVEKAEAADPRVKALLDSLRRTDPKAKTFFSPRAVRVAVAGDGLTADQADALVEGVVAPLRALGFSASGKEGGETLTLTVSEGKLIEHLNDDKGSMMANWPAAAVSCELKIDANWTIGETPLIRVDLSKRGVGFSDVPGSCMKNRIQEIPALVAPRLVTRWDSDHAP